MLTFDNPAFIMKRFGHLSVCSKRAEALSEIFEFIEMERALDTRPQMAVAGHREDVKMSACCDALL